MKNLKYFTVEEKPHAQQQNPRAEIPEPWKNYRVNLFVDNSTLEGAPVIMESNYSYQNLFGKLEYENYYGMLKTDFTMLKPGLLHKANGGYIILQAKDLISHPEKYNKATSYGVAGYVNNLKFVKSTGVFGIIYTPS